MSFFLCVDCGGSKTAAVIVDLNGQLVGRGYGGPSNLTYLASDAYTRAVKVALTEALRAASLPTDLPPLQPTPFVSAWFGTSGADSPTVIQSVLEPLSALVGIPIGPRLIVTNDTNLLAAPIRFHKDASNAVAIIAGTGAIAVSFREDKGLIQELGRAGGWGWILGDEGGGFSVGREAIRQILLRNDRASVGESTSQGSKLKEKILLRFGITDVMEILMSIYLSDPNPILTPSPDAPPVKFVKEKRISTLSPIVFEAAFEDNDPLALEVLRKCANELVETTSVLLGEPTAEKPRLVDPQSSVLSFGGSLAAVERYRGMILEGLKDRGHEFKYVLFVDDAAMTGAASLAAAYKGP